MYFCFFVNSKISRNHFIKYISCMYCRGNLRGQIRRGKPVTLTKKRIHSLVWVVVASYSCAAPVLYGSVQSSQLRRSTVVCVHQSTILVQYWKCSVSNLACQCQVPSYKQYFKVAILFTTRTIVLYLYIEHTVRYVLRQYGSKI